MRGLALIALLTVGLSGCSEAPEPSGFAGLGERVDKTGEQSYLQPGPATGLAFPADLGPHPRYRIEWWYLTANLRTESGQPLGLQWTQFRQALEPREPDAVPDPSAWPLQAAWMAHAAVSWQGEHEFAERLARGDVGNAGATARPFSVWLDHWQLDAVADRRWRLQVTAGNFAYDLTLRVSDQPVAHGINGFSAKSDSGQGSMYFSLVDIAISGTVTFQGQALEVEGRGWFDREWSSQFLKTGQKGWDWFALHLDSGDRLMAFRLREEGKPFVSGTWIPASGQIQPLTSGQLALSVVEQRDGVPVRWQIEVPEQGVSLELSAPAGDYMNRGLYPYWESPVDVSGSHTGEGYMELTGYR
ncbi:carotenoid 1,2-hydratase [Marinobacter pelagius]|uniref:lipocalin-like domain-containing protein n=1 Tax=Marinobacter sp. C7 TaxID=2951363 RepID=UPI001EF0F73A|nr:lipocalin-like domain-containing protein [Marinobacter sp. C7]MCG7200580.1 carotenoid 1,2-hydratase [Marinobacter sp. C7]